MNQEDYDRAFEQGMLFGGGFVFLFMLALMYALALTPAEKLDECQSIMRQHNEHTDQVTK